MSKHVQKQHSWYNLLQLRFSNSISRWSKTFWKLTLCTGWYSCCHGEMWLLWQGAGNLAIYMTAPSFSHFSLSNNILTKWGAIGKSFGIYCRLYCLLACLSLPPILEKDIGRVLKKRFVKSGAIWTFKDVFRYHNQWYMKRESQLSTQQRSDRCYSSWDDK